MKKQTVAALMLAIALATPLAACSSSDSSDTDSDDSETTEEESTDEESDESTDDESDDADESSDDEFDAVYFYEGMWRGSVETTAESAYGDTAGTESMLDVYVYEDGTCEVIPLEDHADLLTDEGTWEGTETELTLHLSDGDIVLTVVDDITLTGDPTDFDIDGFDEITFVLY